MQIDSIPLFILNSIAPIFLLIALGKVLHKTRFLSGDFFKSLNRLVFWLALPCLLISGISEAQLELASISRIALLLTAGTLLTMLLAWGISRRLALPSPKTGSFIQGAFRGNGAFIGLPVIVYSLGTIDPRAEALGTVVLAWVVILFNILGVLLLTHCRRDKRTAGISILAMATELVKNPLIVACALGLALNLLGLHLPRFLFRSMDALGHVSLPLVLMSIGASLEFERLRGAASPSLIASLLKTVAAPLIGFLLAGLFGMDPLERMIAILYLGTPAAAMSYVMAQQMGNDGPLAGRIVALSTLLCAITIPIILAAGL
jgi:predicted permease